METAVSKGIDQVLHLLAPALREVIGRLPQKLQEGLEEIRLRQGRPLAVRCLQGDFFLTAAGITTQVPSEGRLVSEQEIWQTLQLISQGSFYAFEEEMRQGFLTLPGGHRVGLSGRVVLDRGYPKTIKEVGSLNFRIARAVPGAAGEVLPYLLNMAEGRPYHTLIISPPRAGKTTILRDLVRSLSYGVPLLNFPGVSVGVVDERGELASCYQGVPQHDLGPRVDVLDLCPKAVGMLMLLRSMAPQVIATDEIGRSEDVDAIWEMINTGVAVLATAHASSFEELERRPVLREIVAQRVFQRWVLLSRRKGPGTVEAVWDEERKLIRG